MGEFNGTPEINRRMNFSSDSGPKNVAADTTATDTTATDTTATDTTATVTPGAEAAAAQGTQTSQETSAAAETGASTETPTETTEEPKKQYSTDVEGVSCDDEVKVGTDKFPCFDVSHSEFYQNMQDGRRRLRFNQGSNCQKYMAGTRYNRAFYIRHTDAQGKTFVRRVK
jgi:hypothetical protein